jgi:hypothetical protein
MHTMLLHRQHSTYLQQEANSSSSSSSGTQQQQPSKQLRADLLPIPAFHRHQDMLQLLPGGQAYLDAASAAVPETFSKMVCEADMYHTYRTVSSLALTIMYAAAGCQLPGEFPMLQPTALGLVLELQLLAAGCWRGAAAAAAACCCTRSTESTPCKEAAAKLQ